MEKKIYDANEIKKIAPGYRGKPENFDPSKIGKKPASKPTVEKSRNQSRKLPEPTQLEEAKKQTPQKNTPMWADSVFGIDVSVRELEVNLEHTPTLARLPEIVEEVFASIGGDDKNRNKCLTREMLMYYTTALTWARLLDIKVKRGNTNLTYEEIEYNKLMLDQEVNVPQPIYLMLKGLGHVKDMTGKTIYLRNMTLPTHQVQGKGGYPSQMINNESHNMYEEIPLLGICGDILMAQSEENAQPNISVLPPGTQPTMNLVGYFSRLTNQKEEIRILLHSVGITGIAFAETVQGTRLNIHLIQTISDYLGTIPTFRVEKVKMDSLTSEGDSSQFIRSIPTQENTNINTKWTNKVIRPTSANAESVTKFGASYMTGYQLYKEPTNNNHSNWCCLAAMPDGDWIIPPEWILNRNANRALPLGFDANRFVSISDSQLNRTNAIVRRLITSQR